VSHHRRFQLREFASVDYALYRLADCIEQNLKLGVGRVIID
jgi:hypothetical protein